jgi:hypothetical protein
LAVAEVASQKRQKRALACLLQAALLALAVPILMAGVRKPAGLAVAVAVAVL